MPQGSGRRPKPTELRKLNGKAGHRRINDKQPKPAQGEPEIPDGLSKAAKQEWHRIVPELLKLGVLTVIDGKALGAYCAAFARWVEAEREVDKYGLVIEEPVIDPTTGWHRKIGGRALVRLKKNPAITISNEAMKMMKSFLIEFGMTPAARTRLTQTALQMEEDPLDALLKRSFRNADPKHAN